jgi:hypothetical protein
LHSGTLAALGDAELDALGLLNMLHTLYFLIEPREQSASHFQCVLPPEFATALCEPLLVSREFADKSPWRSNEAAIAVKLLHLASVREYELLATDHDALRVLGSGAVAEEVFDRFWSVRTVEFEGKSEHMEKNLSRLIAKVHLTGNLVVDEWLRGLTPHSTGRPTAAR